MAYLMPLSALAQSTNDTGQALEIAPPLLELSANPGATINTQISIRNIAKGKLLVNGKVNDFEANGEDGNPKVILDENETNPYSIKSWVGSLSELTLAPKQINNLKVVIRIPSNAAPGGYYGVIRFTALPPELKGTGVSLSASIGVLVLLRVNGAVKEGMGVKEFSVNKFGQAGTFFETAPLNFVERLENTGNIHEQPTGKITITDMFGRKVANVNVNMPPRNVLPHSTRKFTQPLDSSVIGNRILFGRYTAKLSVVYGDNKQTLTKTISFWVIPYRLIGLIVLLIVTIGAGLYYLIRRYNRYIISRAEKSRRRR